MRKDLVQEVLDKINSYTGTEEQLKQTIIDSDFTNLKAEEYYKQYESLMGAIHPEFNNLDLFLYFFQLLYIYNNKRDVYFKVVKRASFDQQLDKFNDELKSLDTTGRNITATEKQKKVSIDFPNADEISNGQRDLLSFYCRLREFERSISVGKKYLLVIDEIFDYLDDANYIAAQYFLTKFLKENHAEICIVLMTHLDPVHFRSTVFHDSILNVLYLRDEVPRATQEMTKFLCLRQSLDRKNNQGDADLYDLISAYYLHFNPARGNIKADLEARNIVGLKTSWGEGNNYHHFLITEVNKYLSGGALYDPYAVATALRIRIEKVAYDELNQANKTLFLTKTYNTTTKKLKFASDNGVKINEVFFMVIPVTNDADHLAYIKGTQILDEHPLVYKLDHPIIRNIVREIFDYRGTDVSIATIN